MTIDPVLQQQLNIALQTGDVDGIASVIGRLNSDAVRRYRAQLRKHAPYGEWCSRPELCIGKGYCPRDPTCGD